MRRRHSRRRTAMPGDPVWIDTITKSFAYSLAMYIAQVPGYFSAAWFNEKIGRQATIACVGKRALHQKNVLARVVVDVRGECVPYVGPT